MSPQVAHQFTLSIGALLALYMLARFYQGGVCVQCQGRGRHKDDCPLRRDSD